MPGADYTTGTAPLGRRDYHRYMDSPEWRAVRARKLSLQPACEQCGSRRRLQCHHLTYDRLGMELIADLQVLCVDCHRAHHETERALPRAAAPVAVVGPPSENPFWELASAALAWRWHVCAVVAIVVVLLVLGAFDGPKLGAQEQAQVTTALKRHLSPRQRRAIRSVKCTSESTQGYDCTVAFYGDDERAHFYINDSYGTFYRHR